MKTITILFFIVLFQSAILHAQQPQQGQPEQKAVQPQQRTVLTKEQKATVETSQMRVRLALTDSQTVSYQQIALKYIALQEELMKKMAELQQQKSEEIKKILKPDQAEKYGRMTDYRNRVISRLGTVRDTVSGGHK